MEKRKERMKKKKRERGRRQKKKGDSKTPQSEDQTFLSLSKRRFSPALEGF
jgi:hypothetical protein